MVNSPVKALRMETTNDEFVPGLCEKVVDVFMDCSSQCPEAESMIVETDLTFGKKYGCLLTPVVVCSKGQVTVHVRVFNLNPDHIIIPSDVVMGILEPVEVKQWSCWEEQPELQDC